MSIFAHGLGFDCLGDDHHDDCCDCHDHCDCEDNDDSSTNDGLDVNHVDSQEDCNALTGSELDFLNYSFNERACACFLNFNCAIGCPIATPRLNPLVFCECISEEDYNSIFNHGLDENCQPIPDDNHDDCCCHDHHSCGCHDHSCGCDCDSSSNNSHNHQTSITISPVSLEELVERSNGMVIVLNPDSDNDDISSQEIATLTD